MKNKTFRFALVVFSSLLFVLSTLQPAFAADPTNIVARDAEGDGANGFTVLNDADDVETFTIGGSTYAIVVSFADNGVQMINISDPTNIVATDAETDGANGFTELTGADDVDIFTISGSTYAIVVSQTDDGVQIINITDPTNIVATDAETDGANGFIELDGARSVETFTIGGSTYAIVVSFVDDGVQMINISDPTNIVATDAETDGANGFTELDNARGVDTFTIGGSTYAIVAAQLDDGVQMINISDPTNIVATDAETDGANGFIELDGATGVATFTISTSRYAIIASQVDAGVQMINITDPTNIVATDAEIDGANGFTEMEGARGVATFTISTSTYAIVVAATDSGVQMINISDPTNIVATDAETDGANGFTELNVATGVDTFTVSGSTYAIVAAFTDDGVQIIELNTSSSGAAGTPAAASTGGGNEDTGDHIPPTLGVDFNSKRLVTDGFSYNANPIDVQLYYTPYPLITTNVGTNNTAEFKIYDNSGTDKIRHLDFAFGLAKGQILSDSKVRIEWDKKWNGEEIITLIDPNNVLQNVTASSQTINCQDTSNHKCLLLVIYHTFRAPLEFDIVTTNVWDEKRNAWQNYYNHGIEIVGQSLNPPKKYDVIDKGRIYHITETGKNTAVDEFGNIWTFSNTWVKNYIKNERPHDFDWKVMVRTHSNFGDLVKSEITRAEDKLLVLCSECLKSFDDFAPSTTITHPERINKLDNPEIQKKMAFETERAQKIMDALLDIHSSTTWHKQ